MLPYNIIFISIFIFQLIHKIIPLLLNKILLIIFFFIFVLFIGLRHEVGGDWFSYINYLKDLRLSPEKFFDFRSDWGFNLLLYIFFNSKYNIYIVNFICAFIFICGSINLLTILRLEYFKSAFFHAINKW